MRRLIASYNFWFPQRFTRHILNLSCHSFIMNPQIFTFLIIISEISNMLFCSVAPLYSCVQLYLQLYPQVACNAVLALMQELIFRSQSHIGECSSGELLLLSEWQGHTSRLYAKLRCPHLAVPSYFMHIYFVCINLLIKPFARKLQPIFPKM